ncbi:hypothetical protein [Thioclava sp. DLFJ5-1]|uniref:hypothetical protein n=1 Tax=Thioclava sp. DLFJ5-1 TaxID=1915314 RepID=UPI001180E74F|nr:hypothetical protein [Thioclava sp. DLFJ5-1]
MNGLSESIRGIVIGVIVTLLSGLFLWYLQGKLSDKPDVSWFSVANFSLDSKYSWGVEIDELPFEKRIGKADFPAGQYTAREQSIIALRNDGSASAKNLSVILDASPLAVSISPAIIYSAKTLEGGLYSINIPSLGAGESIFIFISGGGYSLVNRVVDDDGVVRKRVLGSINRVESGFFIRYGTIYFLGFILLVIIGSILFSFLFQIPIEEVEVSTLKRRLERLGIPTDTKTTDTEED